jgi:Flp pilus assembly protein TadD
VLASRRAGSELAAELERVVALDPASLDARMDLASAYLATGRELEAAAIYDEVLRRRPRHAGALKVAADLARQRGDHRKAASHYAKLRWLLPGDPRPLFLLAGTQYEAGNLDTAERLFTEAAELPGMLPEAYTNLGAIALRRGEVKQAIWFLARAVKRRPDRPLGRYNHALALHRSGRSADALNELAAAVAVAPDDAGIRFLEGVVCLRLGLLRQATLAFRASVRLDPGREDARHNLAVLEPLMDDRSETSLSRSP